MKFAALFLAIPLAFAQNRFTPGLQPFLTVNAPTIALTHVRVIDGTGAAPAENQTIVIERGKIAAVGPAASVTVPSGAQTLDYAGHTVIPGMVQDCAMHLFYPSGSGIPMYNERWRSAFRASIWPAASPPRAPAAAWSPMPTSTSKGSSTRAACPALGMFITGPYLEGPGSIGAQMHELTSPEDAVRLVDYWASLGVTSFKAYMHITRAELKAAVDEAHKLGLKVTGHLCSVGFREAAAIGIDNLEHGLLVDTEFHPGKQPDDCPAQGTTRSEMERLDIAGQPMRDMIADLVRHNVAVTSTLSVFEAFDGAHPPIEQRFLDSLSPEAAVSYLTARGRARGGADSPAMAQLKKELLNSRWPSSKPAAYWSSAATPRATEAPWPGSATNAISNCWSRADSRPCKRYKSPPKTARSLLGELDRMGTIVIGKARRSGCH